MTMRSSGTFVLVFLIAHCLVIASVTSRRLSSGPSSLPSFVLLALVCRRRSGGHRGSALLVPRSLVGGLWGPSSCASWRVPASIKAGLFQGGMFL